MHFLDKVVDIVIFPVEDKLARHLLPADRFLRIIEIHAILAKLELCVLVFDRFHVELLGNWGNWALPFS